MNISPPNGLETSCRNPVKDSTASSPLDIEFIALAIPLDDRDWETKDVLRQLM